MLVPTEWLLALALLALYVLDSMYFLRIGEAVVETAGTSLKSLSFGSGFELGGRRPYLPNPLTPWRPALRIDWSGASHGPTSQQAGSEMREHLRLVRPIGALASACAALVAGVAPVALVSAHQGIFAIAVLTGLTCAIAACVLLFLRRSRLGLSRGQAASLSAVALICLPCSGNLARAAAAQRRWALPASELSGLGFSPTDQAVLDGRVREILVRAQRLLAEDSPDYQSVTSQLRLLEARADERH